jgi:hypothetical protein
VHPNELVVFVSFERFGQNVVSGVELVDAHRG